MLVNKCENGAAAMGEAAASATGKMSCQLAVKYASLQSNLSFYYGDSIMKPTQKIASAIITTKPCCQGCAK